MKRPPLLIYVLLNQHCFLFYNNASIKTSAERYRHACVNEKEAVHQSANFGRLRAASFIIVEDSSL